MYNIRIQFLYCTYMIITRDIQAFVEYCVQKFPIVVITGPRQSGKTTLAKKIFGTDNYISLEDPDQRDLALKDPRSFLMAAGSGNAILDEVQNCPELFSYIQTIVDHNGRNGQFILTGSQNFQMLEKITQSLAGRVAIITLLPFSVNEIKKCDMAENIEIEQLVYSGFYPPIYDRESNPSLWCRNYITTYLERDVRKLTNVSDLAQFQIFMRLCAGRIGQLINFSSLANEVGVNYGTIKAWLSIMEASYIIYLHRPHFKNFNKRLVKQLKLYFYDTGLACALLSIATPEQMFSHYMKGLLFENMVIVDMIKNRFNKGLDVNFPLKLYQQMVHKS